MRAGVGHCTGPTQRASGMGAASTETLGAMMDLSRLERQDARVRLEAGYLNQLFEQATRATKPLLHTPSRATHAARCSSADLLGKLAAPCRATGSLTS